MHLLVASYNVLLNEKTMSCLQPCFSPFQYKSLSLVAIYWRNNVTKITIMKTLTFLNTKILLLIKYYHYLYKILFIEQ